MITPKITLEKTSNIDGVSLDTVIGKDKDGNPVTLREVKENMAPPDLPKPTLLIIWDDLIQYTSFGVAILHANDNGYEIPSFLKYQERLIGSPKEFIITEFPRITSKYYDNCMVNRYEELLFVSPRSEFFELIFKWGGLYKNIHFVFNTSFDTTQFIRDFELIYKNESRIINTHFLDIVDIESILNNANSKMIMARDMISVYKYMTEEKGIIGMTYIGPVEFNGFTSDFIYSYFLSSENNMNNKEVGPLSSQFIFLEEKLYGNRPS